MKKPKNPKLHGSEEALLRWGIDNKISVDEFSKIVEEATHNVKYTKRMVALYKKWQGQ